MKKVRFLPHQKILFSVLLLGAGAGIFYLYAYPALFGGSAASPEKRVKIFYPTLYSDKHITENAIISDPRFKNTASLKREGFLANVFSPLRSLKTPSAPTEAERGVWLWTPILQITPSYRDAIIKESKINGLKNIYLSIDSYLDIYVLPEGPEKERKKRAFEQTLEDFLARAREAGLTVDAEAGWRNWAEPGHAYKAFAVLEYAQEFNRTHQEKFRGFQYDVEPYLLSSYKENKKLVLRNFLDLINETVTRLEQSDLELSVVIPEFYDGVGGETPRFFYGLRLGYTLEHLLKALERRPGSKIIVMAYRSFALGENGSVEISKDEIKVAAAYQTKVIVAQETGEVPAPHITFHNTTRSYYEEQLEIIDESFAEEENYGGLATHYINSLLTLK